MTERMTKTTKRQVMIFLQGENYIKLKDLIEKRRISRFINEIVSERLQKDDQHLRKQLIEAYKREAKSKETQEEMKVWERVAGDSIDDE